jgi:hypothetical protein
MICPTGKAEYLCKQGWTRNPPDSPSGKSVDMCDQFMMRLQQYRLVGVKADIRLARLDVG